MQRDGKVREREREEREVVAEVQGGGGGGGASAMRGDKYDNLEMGFDDSILI